SSPPEPPPPSAQLLAHQLRKELRMAAGLQIAPPFTRKYAWHKPISHAMPLISLRGLTIRHIIEPARLFLAWHPFLPIPHHRTWRRVTELVRSSEPGGTTLTYLVGTPDYQAAVKQGFTGHPAFPCKQPVHKTGVLESL